MKMIKKLFPGLLKIATLSVLTLSGCQTGPGYTGNNGSGEIAGESAVQQESFETLYDSATSSIPIFYNMYLTVEMSSLFEETGVPFNSKYVNPAENLDNYLTSYKKALNLGVYAVDLSYVKAFEEYDLAGKYFSAMHKLAESLGIPDDFFYDAASRFEKNIENKDSLAYIANEVYTITDNHLKQNNRENTAFLIIVGGWTEAMYLGMNVYMQSGDNTDIYEMLADQKNSLEKVKNLIEVDGQTNDFITNIMESIAGLESAFEKLNNGDNRQQDMKNLYLKISDIRNSIIK
jgi:hypothetical protein